LALKIRKNGAWVDLIQDETGSVTATANGAISAGDPVIIGEYANNAIVSKVATDAYTPTITPGGLEKFTTQTTWDLDFRGARIAYVPDGDYYIICYVANISGDLNKKFLRAKVATVDDSGNITYGPEYKVEDGSTTNITATTGKSSDDSGFDLVYDPDIKNMEHSNGSYYQNYDAVLVCYGEDDKKYTRYLWSTNGTNLSFGDKVEVVDDDRVVSLCLAYNKGIKKFMVTYKTYIGGLWKMFVRLGTPITTVSGGKVNFSSATQLDTGQHLGLAIESDKTSGFIVLYNKLCTGGVRLTGIGIDVDGTTLDVGSYTYLSDCYERSDTSSNEVRDWVVMCAFHEEREKFVIVYSGKRMGGSGAAYILTAVLTLSGTSISSSTPWRTYRYGNLYPTYGDPRTYASLVYDPYLKEVYVHWKPYDEDDQLAINSLPINKNGEILSNGTKNIYLTGEGNIGSYIHLEAVSGAQSGVRTGMNGFAAVGKTHHLFVFKNQSAQYDPGFAKAVKVENRLTNLTESNFLGFSEDTYADNDTAKINTIASVDTNQSGLTIGQKYYVQGNGTLSTTPESNINIEAGVALSATDLLVSGGAVLTSEKIFPPPFSTAGWDI